MLRNLPWTAGAGAAQFCPASVDAGSTDVGIRFLGEYTGDAGPFYAAEGLCGTSPGKADQKRRYAAGIRMEEEVGWTNCCFAGRGAEIRKRLNS